MRSRVTPYREPTASSVSPLDLSANISIALSFLPARILRMFAEIEEISVKTSKLSHPRNLFVSDVSTAIFSSFLNFS